MKTLLKCHLFVVLVFAIISSCQKTATIDTQANNPTTNVPIEDVLFHKITIYNSAKVVQYSADNKTERTLIPVSNSKSVKLYKYYLVEQNTSGADKSVASCLVSKTKIEEGTNLFSLPLGKQGSLNYYDASNENPNIVHQLLLKRKGTDVTNKTAQSDITNPVLTNFIQVDCGYCIDHWWVTYDANTGDVISIDYLGSDCYPCTDPGGGDPCGSYLPPLPTGDDTTHVPPSGSCGTCDIPEKQAFTDYIKMQTIPVMINTSTTSAGMPDPISGSVTWIVAEGLIAKWQVKANTQYSYYHYTIINTPAHSTEESYDLFSYKTVSSYYVGSNLLIQTTWTQTSVQDQVLNNNTAYTQGRSEVHGTLRHVESLPVNLPFCPKVIDVTEEAGNSMTLTVK